MSLAFAVAFAGRALLALLFILAGVAKILGPKPFLEHMAQFHVPRLLLPAVIAVEIVGGVGLLVGWRLPVFAGGLAVFCLATAVVFHRGWAADRAERTLFFKDLALAGALAALAAGAMAQVG